jgi:riboflavin biosynthesis pyrimidine reductase
VVTYGWRNLPDPVTTLGPPQVQSLLVEGGAEVLGRFFDQNLIHMFHFFYAPKFLGARALPASSEAPACSACKTLTRLMTSISAAWARTCWYLGT